MILFIILQQKQIKFQLRFLLGFTKNATYRIYELSIDVFRLMMYSSPPPPQRIYVITLSFERSFRLSTASLILLLLVIGDNVFSLSLLIRNEFFHTLNLRICSNKQCSVVIINNTDGMILIGFFSFLL